MLWSGVRSHTRTPSLRVSEVMSYEEGRAREFHSEGHIQGASNFVPRPRKKLVLSGNYTTLHYSTIFDRHDDIGRVLSDMHAIIVLIVSHRWCLLERQ